jgi:hypothetical protein
MAVIDAALATEYDRRLEEYERKAAAYKSWHQCGWLLVTLPVWATLLLAVAGLAWPDIDWFSPVVLGWVIPALGLVVTLGTALEFALRLRTRWTSYRHAAEHLKNACLRYRAGLDGDGRFREVLEQIKARAGRGEEFRRNYLFSYLIGLPPDLRREYPDLAAERLSSPPGKPLAQLSIPDVIAGRLQHQRRCLLRKMRKYRLAYAVFQAAVVGISLGNAWYVWRFGRDYAWVALSTALSLAVIACRDFLDLDRLTLQYLDTAAGLEALKQEFEGTPPHDLARLRELVRKLEHLLESEWETWYRQHVGAVAIRGGCLPNRG